MVDDVGADVGVDAVFALVVEGGHVGECGEGLGDVVGESEAGHDC